MRARSSPPSTPPVRRADRRGHERLAAAADLLTSARTAGPSRARLIPARSCRLPDRRRRPRRRRKWRVRCRCRRVRLKCRSASARWSARGRPRTGARSTSRSRSDAQWPGKPPALAFAAFSVTDDASAAPLATGSLSVKPGDRWRAAAARCPRPPYAAPDRPTRRARRSLIFALSASGSPTHPASSARNLLADGVTPGVGIAASTMATRVPGRPADHRRRRGADIAPVALGLLVLRASP